MKPLKTDTSVVVQQESTTVTTDCRSKENLLTAAGTPVDVALAIACALNDPHDLLNLAIAVRHYRNKIVLSMGSEQLLSIVEEAARRWLLACPLEDRQKAPKRAIDCYKGLMHEVQRLRTPLAFSQAPESIVVSDNRMEVAKEINCGWRAASCGVTMRAGRHFAQFTLLRGSPSCGIIRPGWDVLIDKGDLTGHCFFETWLGTRCELLAARFHFAVFLCRCVQNWSALLVQCP
jgi:hypothetical protein